MSLQAHIDRLVEQHKSLDKEIEKLEASGHYDDSHLRDLKKQKLHLKDEIDKLRQNKANVGKMRKIANG